RPVDVALLPLRAPDDPPVGDLLDDAGLPAPVGHEDLGLPGQLLVGVLFDGLDLLHERREVLELGPLVVHQPPGRADVDRLHDVGDLLVAASPAAATATAGDALHHALQTAFQAALEPALQGSA